MPTDVKDSARSAGLHYVTDRTPGLSVRRSRRRLIVRDPRGRVVRDRHTLARVAALVLPPAWRDVWVSADPRAHLQATGRDAAGRKQYRYHPDWVAMRDATKYHRMAAFARALPAIRRRVDRDLREPPLSRPYVLATVVRLLERTRMRIGNEEYARQNGSHGLTTLRNRHVEVRGTRVRLDFRAKSGIRQRVEVDDAKLARAVRRCQELPGQMLFQYRDSDRHIHSVSSSDVNAYLQRITRDSFTAKDFRTWAGTVEAAVALDREGPAPTVKERTRRIVAAVDAVAASLGNTRAVCRKCYIHPTVLTAYEQGLTLSSVSAPSEVPRGLSVTESCLIALLEGPTGTHARAA
jgi:DNA topoisomerase-1